MLHPQECRQDYVKSHFPTSCPILPLVPLQQKQSPVKTPPRREHPAGRGRSPSSSKPQKYSQGVRNHS